MDEVIFEGDDTDRFSKPQHRAALRDVRLSWGARGLFVFLWDLPRGWRPNVKHLQTMGTDGRDAVASRLRELVAVGALRFERIEGEKGRFEGTRWVIISPDQWAKEGALKAGQVRKLRREA